MVVDDQADYDGLREKLKQSLEARDCQTATTDLNQLLAFFELRNATDYIDYIEYLFLLHQVYAEMGDAGSAIGVLGKLLSYFLKSTDPKLLKARAIEIYVKTWTYLGYLLAETGQSENSIMVFRKSLPLLMLLRGLESHELETVQWYIKSIATEGRITSEEPPDISVTEDELEGLRCSFCFTGQTEIVSGPSVHICKNCIETYYLFLPDKTYCAHLRLAAPAAACSFNCGSKPDEIEVLFPGFGGFICGACVQKFCDPEYWENN